MAGYGETRTLDGAEHAGAIAMTLFATFSATLVTLLLLHILSVTTAPFFSKAKQDHNEERVFLRMQLGVFVVCLLVSDLCNAVSGLIMGAWAADHMVHDGAACTVQGKYIQPSSLLVSSNTAVLLQFGDVGTAMWNMVVAVHTFMTVVLSKRMSKSIVAAIVVGGWCVVGLLTLIGPLVLVTPDRGPFYGPSAQWCFVRDTYSLERILVHYVPMFISATIILCLYLLVFLTLRGTLITSGGQWRLNLGEDFRARPATPTGQNHGVTQLRSLAKKVLWYPVAYICLILPISVVRLASLDPSRPPIPPAAGQASMCLLYSMGFANCLVYAFTRRIGPTPWFARPPRGNHSVQVYVDRVTHNDIEGGDGSGGSGGSGERGLKGFILSGHSGRSTSKRSFTRKERRSSSGQRTQSPKPDKHQHLDVDLGVINIRRPKPALHFSADSTIAVMGSIASVPGQPYPHAASALDESDEILAEKDYKRFSDDTVETDAPWLKKEGSDDDVLPSP